MTLTHFIDLGFLEGKSDKFTSSRSLRSFWLYTVCLSPTLPVMKHKQTIARMTLQVEKRSSKLLKIINMVFDLSNQILLMLHSNYHFISERIPGIGKSFMAEFPFQTLEPLLQENKRGCMEAPANSLPYHKSSKKENYHFVPERLQ